MREQVQWCLNKLREALNDYNMPAAKDYLEMAGMWLRKEK